MVCHYMYLCTHKETIFRLYTLCVWCPIICIYVHVRRLSLNCVCIVPLYVSMEGDYPWVVYLLHAIIIPCFPDYSTCSELENTLNSNMDEFITVLKDAR